MFESFVYKHDRRTELLVVAPYHLTQFFSSFESFKYLTHSVALEGSGMALADALVDPLACVVLGAKVQTGLLFCVT